MDFTKTGEFALLKLASEGKYNVTEDLLKWALAVIEELEERRQW